MQPILQLPVLVLNANYEPLNVSSVRRAMGLVLHGKAELVLNGRGMVRTPSDAFPCPSIIRLGRMVRRPRPRVKLSKREVFRRDGHTCQYCGQRTQQLTIDHVVPRRHGGSHTWSNVVAACAPCNRRKGGKVPSKARMCLRRKPFEPRPTASYRFGNYTAAHSNWQPFIDGW
jgi:5-methylcytosine-specific restriction endonuclease McrA